MAEKLCYNRGCSKSFDPRANKEDACRFHPGAPFFHDAYKGWSCCQNKSTDFTTFLNTPGCTLGKHSNVKPIEPEKITGNLTKDDTPDVVEVRAPIPDAMVRPPLSTAIVRLKPTIAASLQEQLKNIKITQNGTDEASEIKEGESCKNNGCKNTYQGADGIYNDCKHHPGIPIFHEGMKYWSCCERKTTEFQHFLEQEGCALGSCVWVKSDDKGGEVKCRYDWHQTATHVTVAIYAKKYDPSQSFVEVNPVRLHAKLYFPEEKNSFKLDVELKGIIDVENTTCSMLGTKLEIKMKKAESVSWAKLEVPKDVKPVEPAKTQENMASEESTVDALELDDLDLTPQRMQLSEDARTKKYS